MSLAEKLRLNRKALNLKTPVRLTTYVVEYVKINPPKNNYESGIDDRNKTYGYHFQEAPNKA